MQFHRYEKLEVWKKSLELTKETYRLSEKLPKSEQFILSSQMKRAVLSIPSNIAEGSRRTTKKDFAHFLNMAIGSAAELETQIKVAIHLNFLDNKECEYILTLTNEIMRMLNKLAEYIIKS